MITKVVWVLCIFQIIEANRHFKRQLQNYPKYFQELNPEIQYSYNADVLEMNYPGITFPNHNSVEKPVDEPQEYVPPQSVGAASVPLLPPPAVPVNAAASNVPTVNGAVYLGSGSIGVVRLGNGAYALGSGALGYSDGRGQPRPSIKVPVYPRLPASPNLIPAAVQSQAQPPQPSPSQIQGFHYVYPSGFMQDPNAYEVLRPDSAGFGTPVFRPPRPLRMHFATPTPIRNSQKPQQYTLQLSQAVPGLNSQQFQYYFNHQ